MVDIIHPGPNMTITPAITCHVSGMSDVTTQAMNPPSTIPQIAATSGTIPQIAAIRGVRESCIMGVRAGTHQTLLHDLDKERIPRALTTCHAVRSPIVDRLTILACHGMSSILIFTIFTKQGIVEQPSQIFETRLALEARNL
ncbi:MAG TPA: hypothetical protein VKM55_00010 [Candidatus Lokiarchaeia archaeon]|nr:hypothetical protein [Candidatus Lokiarchaeia archaeon]